jgi:hypothetical protein
MLDPKAFASHVGLQGSLVFNGHKGTVAKQVGNYTTPALGLVEISQSPNLDATPLSVLCDS